MQIRWDQNQETADQVKEKPGSRQANRQADDGGKPSRRPGSGLDGSGLPLKTARAKKFSGMLGDAFTAKVVGAPRTAGNCFPIRMERAFL